jgi:hypothetical protein
MDPCGSLSGGYSQMSPDSIQQVRFCNPSLSNQLRGTRDQHALPENRTGIESVRRCLHASHFLLVLADIFNRMSVLTRLQWPDIFLSWDELLHKSG